MTSDRSICMYAVFQLHPPVFYNNGISTVLYNLLHDVKSVYYIVHSKNNGTRLVRYNTPIKL